MDTVNLEEDDAHGPEGKQPEDEPQVDGERAELHKLLTSHPEIADERIDRPVFILGLNRTGTTFTAPAEAVDLRGSLWAVRFGVRLTF